jgi:hypothetical protein
VLDEQPQRCPFVERERAQNLVEDAARLLTQQNVLGGIRKTVPVPRRDYDTRREARPGCMCFMPGNATQPGPERDGGRETLRLLPDHQQNVLTYILGKDRVAEEPRQIVP